VDGWSTERERKGVRHHPPLPHLKGLQKKERVSYLTGRRRCLRGGGRAFNRFGSRMAEFVNCPGIAFIFFSGSGEVRKQNVYEERPRVIEGVPL